MKLRKIFRKTLSVVLAAAGLCTAAMLAETIAPENESFGGITANAADQFLDNANYEVNSDGGITIKGYWGSEISDIVIPEKIDGKKVTVIGTGLFMGHHEISSITLPDTVKTIESRAFVDIPKLKSFTFPAKVTVLTGNLFGDCTGLTSFIVPDQIKTIEGSAFYGCKNLKTITIGKNVKSIDGFSFKGCDSLKKIIIPESVTYMGDHMFVDENQNKLTGVVIYGKKGSYAQTYANNNGIKFKEYKEVAVSRVKLDISSKTIGAGEKLKVKASVSPSDATNDLVAWSSSDKSVASVSGGTITAKKKGTVTITAKSNNGKKATCKITVKAAPAKVTLNKTSLTLGAGEKYTLKASLSKNSFSSTPLKWTTGSKSVATVKNGVVTAKKAGTAKITVTTYNGKKASCKITVRKAPSKVTMNKTSLTLGTGEKYTLKATLPKNSASGTMKWTTGSKSIATVSNGVVTAKKAGTAKITVTTYNGKKASCKITVKKAPSKITLNKSKLTLELNKTFTLKASLPTGTASGAITYTSSNSKVASVDANGRVTAKKAGTATITAKTFNGKKASCKVTAGHNWVAVTKTVHHEEEFHYENTYIENSYWDGTFVDDYKYDMDGYYHNDDGTVEYTGKKSLTPYGECTPRYRILIEVCKLFTLDDLLDLRYDWMVRKTDSSGKSYYSIMEFCVDGMPEEWSEAIASQYFTNDIFGNGEYDTSCPIIDDKVGTKKVVDKKAYDEVVITGYKCSCGATK